MKKIRLLLIEDNRLLREGLAAMLKKQRNIEMVAASGRYENTRLKIRKLKPNIVLLDLGLRSVNSLHTVELLKREFPDAKVIVIDLAPVQGDVIQFIKAGAAGFILKDTTLEGFFSTIRAVADGAKVLPPFIPKSLFTQIVEHAVTGGRAALKESLRMTTHERKVVGLIGKGLSNKDIGKKLHMTTHAVRSHIHNIMEKLALHARLEITKYGKIGNNLGGIRRDTTAPGR